MYQRQINLSESQSFFLFGARGTGKSELLKQRLSLENTVYIDLLDPELANRLAAYPNDLIGIISPHRHKKTWVIIDEIQKAPQLLELVHKSISQKEFKFALTGSSSRKLKRGAANLLAGRAVVFHLFPLTHLELESDFNLHSVLTFGSLPELYSLGSELDKKRFLKAYAITYLKEEIVTEQIVRNLPPFRRFLDVACTHNTEVVNFSNIARDVGTDPKTIMRYYEILEDTLVGLLLPSYETSIRRQQKKSKKFYFFDTGLARVLANRIDNPLVDKTFEFGQLFESFIVNEVYRLLTYKEEQFKISFIRVSETQEIDLIVQRPSGVTFLCEIKSTEIVDERAAKSLNLLMSDFDNPISLVISRDPVARQFGKVRALPWQEALAEICA